MISNLPPAISAIKNAHRWLRKKLFLLAALGTVLTTSAYAEDYSAYAAAIAQQKEAVIAPYTAQALELTRRVLQRQQQQDITAFKAELKTANDRLLGDKHSPTSPILIFVSFSMPKESLRGWLREAQQIQAPLYIRGLVNNSFKDTFKAVGDLIQNQQGGVLVDPPLFKKYGIAQVPAVVVTYGEDAFDIIYGDVKLEYALQKIGEGSNDARIVDAIQKLRGSKYKL